MLPVPAPLDTRPRVALPLRPPRHAKAPQHLVHRGLRHAHRCSDLAERLAGLVPADDLRVASPVPARPTDACSVEAEVDGATLLFVGATGAPLRATHFRKRVWAPALKAAGLDGQGFTFRALRHSAVGFLIAVNAPPRVIERRMGHRSIRVTFDVYGSVLPQVEESVTESLTSLFTTPVVQMWCKTRTEGRR